MIKIKYNSNSFVIIKSQIYKTEEDKIAVGNTIYPIVSEIGKKINRR